MSRRVTSVVVFVGIAVLAWAGAAPCRSAPTAERQLRDRLGADWSLQRGSDGRARRLAGGARRWSPAGALGASDHARLIRLALDFATEQAELLDLDPGSLQAAALPVVVAQGGRIAVVHLDVAREGIVVEGGRVSFVINRGSLVLWHATNTRPVAVDLRPSIDPEVARARALKETKLSEDDLSPLSGVVLGLLPEGSGHRLAWRVRLVAPEDLRDWTAWVDAQDGTLLSLTDGTLSGCVLEPPPSRGRVLGGVRPTGATDEERLELLPLATIESDAGSEVVGGVDGLFEREPGALTARLRGPAVEVACRRCTEPVLDEGGEQRSGDLDFGFGGVDYETNGSSYPADRTTFFHVERASRMASRWLDLPFLQTPISAITNSYSIWASSCNAFYSAGTISFLPASPGRCGNTGEIRDVISHEWGHALDAEDGTGLARDGTAEAVADIVALLRGRDACIGEGFSLDTDQVPFPSDACSGVRDLDELAPGHEQGEPGTLHADTVLEDCGSGVHCTGQVFGQAFWHFVQSLASGRSYVDDRELPFEPLGKESSWQVSESLFFSALPVFSSQYPSHQQDDGISAYDAFLAVDDEGDGIANGTPHAAAIRDAFEHHGLHELDDPVDDTEDCDVADPRYYAGLRLDPETRRPQVELRWEDAGAAAYHVLRADAPDDSFLSIHVAGPGAGELVDEGILPGRAYAYRVVAEAADTCLSAGRDIRIVETSDAIASFRLDDPPPLGNGDGLLAPGESAWLHVDLHHVAGPDLFDVGVSLTSLSPDLQVLGPDEIVHAVVPAGGFSLAPEPFVVQARPGVERHVTLEAEIAHDGGCTVTPHVLEIADSHFRLRGLRLIDSPPDGNDDGHWQELESVGLEITVANDGLLDARDVAGTLVFANDPPAGFTIDVDAARFADVPAGGTASSVVPHFRLTAPAGLRRRTPVELALLTSAEGRPREVLTFTLHADGRLACDWPAVESLLEAPEPRLARRGSSVAIDGRLAASARGDGWTGMPDVSIYQDQPDGWRHRWSLPWPGEGSRFGASLALQGDRLVVGSPRVSEGVGVVTIHVLRDDDWVLEQEISLPEASYLFGSSVALDGGTLVVGDPLSAEGCPAGDDPCFTGAVHVYRQVAGSWEEEARFSAPLWAKLGDQVRVSGDVIGALAGSLRNEHGERGIVFLWRRIGDEWQEDGQVHPDSPNLRARGEVFDLQGDWLALGSPRELAGPGRVRLFHRESGSWVLDSVLDPPDDAAPFGRGLHLEGSMLLAAAPGYGGFADPPGRIFVYQREGGAWVPVDEVTSPEPASGDYFGAILDASRDKAVVGLPNHRALEGATAILCIPAGERDCDDGFDQDADGLTDCVDPSCEGIAGPDGVPCEPSGETSCDDGGDNDGDGLVDCDDPDCTSSCPEVDCGDGFDDDLDGLVDCADADCRGEVGPDGTPCENPESSCGDSLDNDGDGLVDCDDLDCAASCPELDCDDGFDQDVDGLVDCTDPDCLGRPGPGGGACEQPESSCADGADNDADGAIDCDDPDCAASCPELDCDDSLDEDLDGLIDCDDPDCAESCPEPICDDGIDQDRDGLTDCADPDCLGRPGPGGGVCEEPEVSCGDGADNDGDGDADCADEDCLTQCPEARCANGLDEDLDGLVDCEDPECEGLVGPDGVTCQLGVERDCRDGGDNDGDVSADCEDSDCVADEACADTDFDGDGVSNAEDCAPLDPTAQAVPAELRDFRVSQPETDELLFTWEPTYVQAGSGSRIDLLMGELSLLGLPNYEPQCLLRDADGSSHRDARPMDGRSHYFLPRAGNACGPLGGDAWGRDSLGGSRVACP